MCKLTTVCKALKCSYRLLTAYSVCTHGCYDVIFDDCRSVFYLPKPRPLNYLVQDLYGGPTLLLQGAKVPYVPNPPPPAP